MATAAELALLAQITQIQTLIASGVDSAGYGDKRTEFRTLNELRQILNDLLRQLALLQGTKATRQIRMITPADKGL